jgi:DNA-binding NarL/FixJ family response regulator
MRVTDHPTVLVADYFEDTREMLRFWLKAEGFRVVEAANGQEAIELTRARCPDLILMALRLEQINARAAGCSSFIAQPIDFSYLRNQLSQLLPTAARSPAQGIV